MSEPRMKRLWPRVVSLLVVLYVLSSGPMHAVAFRNADIIGINQGGSVMLGGMEGWWGFAYAPLVWISEHRWGKPIKWYWNLFPIVQAKE